MQNILVGLVKWFRRIIEQSLMTSVYMKGAGWARQYTREQLTVHEDGLTVCIQVWARTVY